MKATLKELITRYEIALIRLNKRECKTISWKRFKFRYITNKGKCILCKRVILLTGTLFSNIECSLCPLRFAHYTTYACINHPTFIRIERYEKSILIDKVKRRIKYLKQIYKTL